MEAQSYAASRIVTYDRSRNLVVLAAPDERGNPSPITADWSAAIALAAGVPTLMALPLAGYTLVMVAAVRRSWPSEARRSAILQVAEQLRQARPADLAQHTLLDALISRADAAILAGADAETAMLDWLISELARIDRANERCGRRAAALLDDGDRVLLSDPGDAAQLWMLAASRETAQHVVPIVPAGSLHDGDICGLLAAVGFSAPRSATASNPSDATLVCAAATVARDGSALADPATAAWLLAAQNTALPRYVLAPDGPTIETTADTGDLVALPPGVVSAIITSRGIYRPEMIARHLHDHDAPLDIIPLQ